MKFDTYLIKINEGTNERGLKMKETEKTHTWNTSTGAMVTATAKLTLKKTINADGDKVEVDCCEMHFGIEVEGMRTGGMVLRKLNTPKKVGSMTAVASWGKLAMNEENYNACLAIIAEVESHPAWIAKQAAIEAADKADAEYHAHYNRVIKAMAE